MVVVGVIFSMLAGRAFLFSDQPFAVLDDEPIIDVELPWDGGYPCVMFSESSESPIKSYSLPAFWSGA